MPFPECTVRGVTKPRNERITHVHTAAAGAGLQDRVPDADILTQHGHGAAAGLPHRLHRRPGCLPALLARLPPGRAWWGSKLHFPLLKVLQHDRSSTFSLCSSSGKPVRKTVGPTTSTLFLRSHQNTGTACGSCCASRVSSASRNCRQGPGTVCLQCGTQPVLEACLLLMTISRHCDTISCMISEPVHHMCMQAVPFQPPTQPSIGV